MNSKVSMMKSAVVAVALAASISGIARADDNSMNPFTGDSWAYFNGADVGHATALHPAPVAIDRAASARTASEMAACKKLPISEMFTCEDQAGYGQKVLRPAALSAGQETALKNENARYQAEAAACRRGPISELTTCLSLAGNGATLRSAS